MVRRRNLSQEIHVQLNQFLLHSQYEFIVLRLISFHLFYCTASRSSTSEIHLNCTNPKCFFRNFFTMLQRLTKPLNFSSLTFIPVSTGESFVFWQIVNFIERLSVRSRWLGGIKRQDAENASFSHLLPTH